MDGGLRRRHVLVFVVAWFAWLGHLGEPTASAILFAVVAAVTIPLAVRGDALRAAELRAGAEPTTLLALLRHYVVRWRRPLAAVIAVAWAVHAQDRYERWWATLLVAGAAYAAVAFAARPLAPGGPGQEAAPPSLKAALRGTHEAGLDGFVADAGSGWLYVAAFGCFAVGGDDPRPWHGLLRLAGTVLLVLTLRGVVLQYGRASRGWPPPVVLLTRAVLGSAAAVAAWHAMAGELGPPWPAAAAVTAGVAMALAVRPFPAWLPVRG